MNMDINLNNERDWLKAGAILCLWATIVTYNWCVGGVL
jgi:hypothetical protein